MSKPKNRFSLYSSEHLQRGRGSMKIETQKWSFIIQPLREKERTYIIFSNFSFFPMVVKGALSLIPRKHFELAMPLLSVVQKTNEYTLIFLSLRVSVVRYRVGCLVRFFLLKCVKLHFAFITLSPFCMALTFHSHLCVAIARMKKKSQCKLHSLFCFCKALQCISSLWTVRVCDRHRIGYQ